MISSIFNWFFSDGDHTVATATFILAIAAGCQFELMRRTAKRQLRAYIFVDQSGLSEGTLLTPPLPKFANQPGVAFVFKNSGQTPAYNVVSWGQIDIVEPRHEGTLVVPPLELKHAMSVGAGCIFNKALWYGRALNAQEIADVAQGAKAIYFYGRVEYEDVFKRKRFTNFRQYYHGVFPNAGGMNFSTCEKGNEAS